MATLYLTVAIPYVNAAPHVGYAYELVQADVHARARRARGDHVRFLGGTDDYSLKNVLAAEAAGVPTRELVDRHAASFEALRGPLGLSFDDFIRTSADSRHVPAVHRLWRAAAASGDLYEREYEGDYCVGCEQYYGTDEAPTGDCPEHGTPLERVAERNWFFRLSRYQDRLQELIGSDRLQVRPAPFRNEVLAFLRRGVEDISVSRSVDRARGWGVPVPDDPTQVVYVWFDALANYISALGYGRPDSPDHRRWWQESDERVHVVGKGILRFHAVYWPAFLASAGEPPPTRIQVHPYLTVGGAKLAKSSGAAADPVDLVARFGTDALRWWFAREVAAVADTDFTVERLVDRANEDLAGGLSNVCHRIVTLVHRHRGGVVPDHPARPVEATVDLPELVTGLLGDFDLRGAAAAILEAVGALNQDLEATEPWRVARDPRAADELDDLLLRHLRSARLIAAACAPVAPALSARLLHQLGDERLPPAQPVCTRLTPPGTDRATA